MKPAPSVLIIDASHESREVLRLLLERRGARTIEAERVEEAVGLANRCHPDLIVFDAECDHSSGGDATIFGQSITSSMSEIRKVMGVCPQHDILWKQLSAEEHLFLFAQIRGVPPPSPFPS